MAKKINKVRNLEDYSLICPKEFNRKYKKNVRNLIGYMLYCQNMYSDQVLNNDGWFFVPLRRIMGATGIGSFTTAVLWLGKLSMDGIIETKKCYSFDPETGEKTTQKNTANCYRFSDALRTSLPNSYVKKCSTDIVEDEDVNEKSVALNFENKCSIESGTVIDTETDIEKELDTTYSKSNFIDKVGSLTVASSLQSDLNNSNMKNINRNEQKENVNCLTTVTGERTVFERIDKLFSKDGFGGLNQKVLSKAPNYNKEGRYSQGEQKGGISWFWKKWESFEEWLNTVDIPFAELRQYMRTFKHLIEHYYTDERERKEKAENFSKQVYVIFRRYFFKEYESFSSSLSELSRQQCKQLWNKFYSEFERLFKDSDGYSETKYAFEMKYSEAFRKVYPLTEKVIEDPDELYRNLSDSEESTVKTVYTHETNKGGGCYNDLPY